MMSADDVQARPVLGKRRRWPLVAALLVVMIAAGGLAFGLRRDPGPPVPVGRLLFSDRPAYKLFRSGDAAPSDLDPISDPDIWLSEYAFSPQGDRLAFENPLDQSIYVVDIDGSNLRRLTTSGISSSPSWSPDGAQILFFSFDLSISDRESEARAGFYTINADGTGLRRLPIPLLLLGHDPAWSPDGRSLAYAYFPNAPGFWFERSKSTDIAVINLDGSGFRLLTDAFNNSNPAWSPDGRTIAYEMSDPNTSNGRLEIATVNVDGTNQRRLTANDVSDSTPAWSPDGRYLAFMRRRGSDDHQIFLMDADGSNQRFLHNGQYPIWAR